MHTQIRNVSLCRFYEDGQIRYDSYPLSSGMVLSDEGVRNI